MTTKYMDLTRLSPEKAEKRKIMLDYLGLAPDLDPVQTAKKDARDILDKHREKLRRALENDVGQKRRNNLT